MSQCGQAPPHLKVIMVQGSPDLPGLDGYCVPHPQAYLLFPMSMMTMFELECCLASSSHVVRCSNVSFLKTENDDLIWYPVEHHFHFPANFITSKF